MKIRIITAGLLLNTAALFAAGPHEAVSCLGCHSLHFAIDDKAFAVKNEVMKLPITGKDIQNMTAKNCLGCHELPEFGGAGVRPVHLHTTHPIGVVPNPKIADMPENLRKSNMIDCISCHDPHPSNTNFMYLRVDTGKSGENIQKFCVTCHSAKGDLAMIGIKSPKEIKLFTSMDQERGPGFYPRDSVVIQNVTPSYIVPLGKLPENDLLPNYQNPPSWVYAPEINPLKLFDKPAASTKTATPPAK